MHNVVTSGKLLHTLPHKGVMAGDVHQGGPERPGVGGLRTPKYFLRKFFWLFCTIFFGNFDNSFPKELSKIASYADFLGIKFSPWNSAPRLFHCLHEGCS